MHFPQSHSEHSPTLVRDLAPETAAFDEHAQRMDFEPSEPGMLAAARRHPRIIVLAIAVCLALAGLAAAVRSPVYTAKAQLGIGRIDVSTYSVPGFVGASRDLAAAYSRAMETTAVTAPLARQLHTTPEEIDRRLAASPIPESSLIVVTAKGSTEPKAVELANAAKSGLIAYVTRLNRSNPDSARLLDSFERASLQFQAARAARAKAHARGGALDALDAKVARAELEVKTLNGLYQASQQGQAATDVVQVLSPARTADSDFWPFLQRMLFVGLVAGLVGGLALALLREKGYLPTRA
jgi:capsular polysaccharide biosynthesis protein